MREFLREHSVEVMKRGQARNGAFLASPVFGTYQYCWLRDGTFVAYALDRAGEHERARRFYEWVHGAVLKHRGKVEALLRQKERGERPHPDAFLHTRFTVDGEEGTEPWGNFQFDGYGAYLWGVAEHVERTGDQAFWQRVEESVRVVVEYLLAFWGEPNFDCWEEHGDRVHPSTLAAVYAGVTAVRKWLVEEDDQGDAGNACDAGNVGNVGNVGNACDGGSLRARIDTVCEEIRAFVELHGVVNGRFCKSVGSEWVDANLLWLAVPFGLFEVGDVRVIRTVEAIEAELVTGGVHRYREDRFYGGGAWILLTAWLGWYYVQLGDWERAEELLRWCEQQADEQGHFPEQVPEGLLFPDAHGEWVARWGEPAKPLLWSHAMYVVLHDELAQARRENA